MSQKLTHSFSSPDLCGLYFVGASTELLVKHAVQQSLNPVCKGDVVDFHLEILCNIITIWNRRQIIKLSGISGNFCSKQPFQISISHRWIYQQWSTSIAINNTDQWVNILMYQILEPCSFFHHKSNLCFSSVIYILKKIYIIIKSILNYFLQRDE